MARLNTYHKKWEDDDIEQAIRMIDYKYLRNYLRFMLIGLVFSLGFSIFQIYVLIKSFTFTGLLFTLLTQVFNYRNFSDYFKSYKKFKAMKNEVILGAL